MVVAGFESDGQDVYCDLRVRNVHQAVRLWLQKIFHRCLVLARLRHRRCELNIIARR